MEDRGSSELLPQRIDRLAAAARGVVGAVPFGGALLAEIVTQVIPNQRIDRIADVLARLEAKLESLEEGRVQQVLETPEAVDLLEDGMIQASRAVTDERREHIATLLKNGITSDDLVHLERKRVLELLSQVSDAELIILQSYALRPDSRQEFFDRHEDVLHGVWPDLNSTATEVDRAAVQSTYRQRLRDLGLIQLKFKQPRRGELPEFDPKTGMMKSSGDQLTTLGRLLLRYLDLPVEL